MSAGPPRPPRTAPAAAPGPSLGRTAGPPLWRDLAETGWDGPRGRAAATAGPPTEGGLDRREFLRLVGGSLALAGLGGCGRAPEEEILPYVEAPEGMVPGQPLFYASALPLDGYARGVLVETTMGRPIKVEGNRRHPASLGGTDVHAQAAVLDLWDPDRSQSTLRRGEPATWEALLAELDGHRRRLEGRQGEGLAILTGTLTSPTLAAQLDALLKRFPEARWYHPPPGGEAAALAASTAAFGAPLLPRPRLERAAVVLTLDADPLGPGPDQVALARAFARARRAEADPFPRLYAVEPTPTLTGAMADHRLPLRNWQVEALARQVARRIGLDLAPPPSAGLPQSWLDAVAADLREAGPRALVLAGAYQPESVHRLACAMNAQLGALGTTLTYAPSAAVTATPHAGDLTALASDLRGGGIDLLLILDTNPVYEAPADLRFGDALGQAGTSVHLGLYADETAAASDWHVPEAHPLEAWGDLRSVGGTASLVQPTIAPLYEGRTSVELLDSLFQVGGPRRPYDLVRKHWRKRLGDQDFESAWQDCLRQGVVKDTGLDAQEVSLASGWSSGLSPAPEPPGEGLDLLFRPDPHVRDGRFANNAWLQELPKPFTGLTWENAALVAPETARRLGLSDGDLADIQLGERRLQVPIVRLPGQAPDTLTLPLGYGRRRAGRLGTGIGFDANVLRTSTASWSATGAKVAGLKGEASANALGRVASAGAPGHQVVLARTQNHHRMADHHPARTATLDAYATAPETLVNERAPLPSLYPERGDGGHAWGMSIDLNACIGCNACTIACQAENNIPSVGKEQVLRGREMHWIRVDNYFEGPPAAPAIRFQPVPCMHCELAPCEVVCPVGATLHDSEGLNLQVYNRCVGTRFCSNNCPYKVRRFNFLQFTGDEGAARQAQYNPQVTVRMRGVMEKCTYCLQRINAGRIQAQTEGRALRDGDIVTACQGACPTEAIVFGDLALPDSQVSRAKASPRTYSVLQELNTRPRTTYLVRLSNPSRALAGTDPEEASS